MSNTSPDNLTPFEQFALENEAVERTRPLTQYEVAVRDYEHAVLAHRTAVRAADIQINAIKAGVAKARLRMVQAKELRDSLAPPPRPRGRPRKTP